MEYPLPNEMVQPHPPHSMPIYFVLECRGEKEWTKVDYPYEYEAFTAKACEVYPFLLHTNFSFTDEFGAKLSTEFLREYVQMSPRGVILKIKEVIDSNLDIHGLRGFGSPQSSASTVTYVSTDDTDIEHIVTEPELPRKYALTRKSNDDNISKEA